MRIDPTTHKTNMLSPAKQAPINQDKRPVNQKMSKGPEEALETLLAVYGEKKLKALGAITCATCASRTYQDGSDDPGVSFKAPGHIAPEASAQVVMGHELEHVNREQAKADSEGKEVISQSVILSRAICPECGRAYVSGGETKTTTKTKTPYEHPSRELVKGLHLDQQV